jgi:protein-S-isoprenylcysteine O-methyltransferase Ste14
VTAPIIRLLARHRVRIGFAAAIVALWLATPTRASLAAGTAIAILGEALRIWAAGHLDKGREVTASGPYRLTRHPLYLGSGIIGIGFAIASANWVTASLVVLYLAMTLTSAMQSEERHLTEKFGRAYPEYREGRAPEIGRRFSLTRVVANREYRAVAGLAFALALLAWKLL